MVVTDDKALDTTEVSIPYAEELNTVFKPRQTAP
jgi:hypothetical protein